MIGRRDPPSSGIDEPAVLFDPIDQGLLAVFSENAAQAGATVADQRETDTMVFDQLREAIGAKDRVPARKTAQCNDRIAGCDDDRCRLTGIDRGQQIGLALMISPQKVEELGVAAERAGDQRPATSACAGSRPLRSERAVARPGSRYCP